MKYLKYDEKLAQCFSSVIMDTLDSLGSRLQCMRPDIRPLVPSMRTWGEAVTARFAAVRELPQSPYGLEIQVVDDLREGHLLVTQCDTQELSAAWGGLLTTAARSRKARGVVTDGGARDYAEIVELGFPTFCRGLTPYDSLGRMDVVETNVAILCGGIAVRPGDLEGLGESQRREQGSRRSACRSERYGDFREVPNSLNVVFGITPRRRAFPSYFPKCSCLDHSGELSAARMRVSTHCTSPDLRAACHRGFT